MARNCAALKIDPVGVLLLYRTRDPGFLAVLQSVIELRDADVQAENARHEREMRNIRRRK